MYSFPRPRDFCGTSRPFKGALVAFRPNGVLSTISSVSLLGHEILSVVAAASAMGQAILASAFGIPSPVRMGQSDSHLALVWTHTPHRASGQEEAIRKTRNLNHGRLAGFPSDLEALLSSLDPRGPAPLRMSKSFLVLCASGLLLLNATVAAIQHTSQSKHVQHQSSNTPFGIVLQCLLALALGTWGVVANQGNFVPIRTTTHLSKHTVDALDPGPEFVHFNTREIR